MTSTSSFHKFSRPRALALAAVVALGTAGVAHAQSTSSRQGPSWLPYTHSGYVGINLGQSKYDVGCGLIGSCDDSDARMTVYTGGLFNDMFGGEIGYVYEGAMNRGGGTTRADGATFRLVARLPVQQFNVFAKGGAIYGRTRVSADALSGVAGGREKGWGVSWGAGVGYDFTRNHGVVVEWSRNEFDFPGIGKNDVDSTSVGYVYRF